VLPGKTVVKTVGGLFRISGHGAYTQVHFVA